MPSRNQLFTVFAITLAVPAVASATEVPFSAGHGINSDPYDATSVIAADFDGDGMTDLVSSSAGGSDAVFFWRNDGSPSGWPRQRISEDVFNEAWHVQAGDIDGDGDLDVVGAAKAATSSSGVGARDLVWWENDGTPANGYWVAHTIDEGTNGARAVAVADIDGDGDLDVVATNIAGILSDVTWFSNNGSGGGWSRTRLNQGTTLETYGPYGVDVADIDGDGDLDVVSSGTTAGQLTWWENKPGTWPWPKTTFVPVFPGAGHVRAADMDRDGDMDVVAAAHSGDEVRWFENNGPGFGWTTHTVDSSFDGVLAVEVADLDLDGDPDIVAAADGADSIRWYDNTSGGGAGWVARTVQTSFGDARSVAVADLDRDGDPDVIGAAKAADLVAWWSNDTIHRSARFSNNYTHRDDLPLADTVATAVVDVNGDGSLDVVALSRNTSFDGDDLVVFLYDAALGGFWTHGVSGAIYNGSGVTADDVDGDGDTDIVVTHGDAASGGVRLFQNQGGIIPDFSALVMGGGCVDARSPVTCDLDGDGDLDLVAACPGDDLVATWENDGGWTRRDIGGAIADVVVAGDITGDGSMDLVIGRAGALDDIIILDGADDYTWGSHWVEVNADDPADLAIGDVNGDGDLDILAALSTGDEVAWWEHPNGGWQDPWSRHTIAAVDSATGVACADLDADGDLDVVATSAGLNDTVWWFANRSDGVPSWAGYDFASTLIDGPASPSIADLDRDGYPDIVVAGAQDTDLPVYWNFGGQFYVAVWPPAGETIQEGSSKAVLKLSFVNEGLFSDNDMEVASVQVRFTDAGGAALTSAEANAIIDSISLRRDDGDGVPDEGDVFVCMDSDLVLDNGREDLTAADGDLDAMVPANTVVSFWLIVTMTSNADSQTVDAFRVTHLSDWNPASSAEDRDHDIPLRIQATGNGGSYLLNIGPAAGDLIFVDGFESGDMIEWSASNG